ncbi:MAG TPA: DNA translocase FtsK 4TM domain-containing protein [Saprospiraceae bacterium]|nr:DNA translocase FtsK 4TM domain-containing protein [Saprospiraceae bacterium]HPI06982.1 DNA translocase FtsK 4TM domain-containing protein [Saprospiraceae bacterium]
MAAKKRGQLSMNFDGERVSKLFGIFFLFLSFYLFIAFTSYFFTWKNDHDIVFRFSWDVFWDDLPVDNWLGRLGAFVSDTIIYWGFGVASYGFVYLLYKYGLALVRRSGLGYLTITLQRTVILMVIISVVSSFFLQKFEFPWGGVFGQAISDYIQNFLGIIGTVALMIFALVATFVWSNNPDLEEFTWLKLWDETKLAWRDLLTGNFGKRQKAAAAARTARQRPETVSGGTINEAIAGLEARETVAPPVVAPPTAAQLALDLSQRSALFADDAPKQELPPRPEPLKPGNDSDLEIIAPVAPPIVTPDEADAYKPPVVAVQEETANLTEPYDPTLELSGYEYPHLQLLVEHDNSVLEIDREELETNKNQILQTLMYFKIEIEKIKATIGPTVTLYEIIPAKGIRISKIKNLEDDIALNLSALGIRIIAPIPGKGTIGIEVPNKKRQTVGIREVLKDEKFKRAKMELPIALGKTIQNEVFVADLAKMPHLLVAGATGQGKSVGINVVLMSLLYKKHPSQVKLILIDPKKVELFPYAHLENHFLGFLPDQTEPIVTDTTKVVHTLNSLIIEMETRYDLLKKAEVRNISEYNEKFVSRRLNPNKGHRFLPYIVLIIDEFADLIMTAGKEIELPIGRLAQLARAVGIHLIIATQRPSVNIITGVIKANFPARIAFKVASKVDSRTILDTGGAEQLTGRGDMLLSVGGDIIRLQSAFVDTPEVERVIDFIASQQGFAEPFFLPEFHPDGEPSAGGNKEFRLADMDEMLEDAAKLVVETQHGSTSMIQRRMKLGYNRAGRIMDQLEGLGIVGPAEGSKPREVLFYSMDELLRFMTELNKRK